MREEKIHIKPYYAVVIGLIAGVISLVVFLLFQIQVLNGRVGELEAQAITLQTQLATYERTLCSGDANAIGANAVQKYTIRSAGYQRTYQVHTPVNYDPSVRYPVVLSFDGIEGSGGRMRAYSSLDALPAIVVYPDALQGTKGYTAWQGAPYSVSGERDIQFVRQILEILPSHYCIDSTKQFAVGMSNGGSFAAIVGCEMGDQIRAVASVSGAFYTTCQREERTPSLLVIHSISDNQVPFMGAATRRLPQIQQWVSDQSTKRNCQIELPATTTGSTTYYNWLDCADDSMLRFVVLRDQPHGWLAIPKVSNNNIDTTADYIWKFFEDSIYI